MKPRRLLVSLMALMLVMPAATAYGTDQSVEVTVLPAGLLTVEVDTQAGFGVMIPGGTADWGFNMNVTNTSDPATGWEVTVDAAGDFVSGNWEYCDESGCYNWVPDEEVAAIAIANLSITGGDYPWWDGGGDEIVPGSGSFGGGPIAIDTGSALAWGGIWLNDPIPTLVLAVPGGTTTGLNYMTVLTYTITATP